MASINTNRRSSYMGIYGIRSETAGHIFGVLEHMLYFDDVLKPAARAQVEIFGCGVDKVGIVLFTRHYKSIIASLFVI